MYVCVVVCVENDTTCECTNRWRESKCWKVIVLDLALFKHFRIHYSTLQTATEKEKFTIRQRNQPNILLNRYYEHILSGDTEHRRLHTLLCRYENCDFYTKFKKNAKSFIVEMSFQEKSFHQNGLKCLRKCQML